ncbi:dihydrolipoyl dehydrogenase [Deinococcus roseus]|uniref:Dihydrolipoyl dehydrogenase n=1 Tax=Deinococcus roseus TaxID=392414 RepID=A0ABQ2DDB5_9DEIO|nr:dihydrolipoyl dehydrogenase [Deinococcus roseus]GGJ54211.1 dihydrolipoyl dehydrogenase [Deinococcus roseus]
MSEYDVLVIGGGPGGYVAAIRAAQLGFKVACVDAFSNKEGKQSLGGTCLNVGCIPSKALLDSTHKLEAVQHEYADHGIEVSGVKLDLAKLMGRKDSIVKQLTGGIQMLFKKNKVTAYHGYGTLDRQEGEQWVVKVGEEELKARHVILATGSKPRELPFFKFGGNILDNVGALSLDQIPAKLGVIGAGVIGLELGSVWRRMGSEVTALEAGGFLEIADEGIAKEALRHFQKQGMKIILNVKISRVEDLGDKVVVTYTDGNGEQTYECDKLIASVGRIPNTDNLGAAKVGLELTERGFIKIDEHYHTNLKGVYAIGDVVGGLMLAHKAEDEGVACAELIAGQAGHVNYDCVPSVIYTSPEIAWVGPTEKQLKDKGVEYKVGSFKFIANGRALAHDDTRGFVKIIADAKTDRLIAAHMIGPSVSELIGEVVTVMEFGGSAEDLARTVHAHPTLSEAVKEAAMGVDKRMIHS